MKVQVFFLSLLTSTVVFAQISAKLGGAPGEPGAHEPLIGSWRLVSTDLARKVWRSEEGQDIAEYAVMLAVILVLVIGTVRLIGGNANNVFSTTASIIQ